MLQLPASRPNRLQSEHCIIPGLPAPWLSFPGASQRAANPSPSTTRYASKLPPAQPWDGLAGSGPAQMRATDSICSALSAPLPRQMPPIPGPAAFVLNLKGTALRATDLV